MATVGMYQDVNNSIFMEQGFPVGRAFGYVPPDATSFDTRSNIVGELGGLNQDYMSATVASQATTRDRGMAGGSSQGRKPAMWFLTWAIIFVIVAWAAHRYASDGEQFAIIRPNLINGVFLTLWIVLILVFLKQVAIRMKRVPGLSALGDMILSA